MIFPILFNCVTTHTKNPPSRDYITLRPKAAKYKSSTKTVAPLSLCDYCWPNLKLLRMKSRLTFPFYFRWLALQMLTQRRDARFCQPPAATRALQCWRRKIVPLDNASDVVWEESSFPDAKLHNRVKLLLVAWPIVVLYRNCIKFFVRTPGEQFPTPLPWPLHLTHDAAWCVDITSIGRLESYWPID